MSERIPNQERLFNSLMEEREKFLSTTAKNRLLDYVLTFNTEHGRRVLADLHASYDGISFVPGYSDVTAFKEGRRSVKDDIVELLKRAEMLGVTPKTPQPRRQ